MLTPPLLGRLRFLLARGDQRLAHDSGEEVPAARLQELGLFSQYIQVEGRSEEEWTKDIGRFPPCLLAFSLSGCCPMLGCQCCGALSPAVYCSGTRRRSYSNGQRIGVRSGSRRFRVGVPRMLRRQTTEWRQREWREAFACPSHRPGSSQNGSLCPAVLEAQEREKREIAHH